MALELRPNCELCDKDLSPNSAEAMICTYECTYCTSCVHQLENVCPNCGGGFVLRPIRPSKAWRDGVSLSHQPASTQRVNGRYTLKELKPHIEKIRDIAPKDR